MSTHHNMNTKSLNRALKSNIPFIRKYRPFIGTSTSLTLPFICRNKPFVRFGRENGFTLVELMITLAILSIITSFALPSFREIILNQRIGSDTNELVGSLNLARSESVKRKIPVAVCSKQAGAQACNAGGAWNEGWLVWVDNNRDGIYDAGEEILREKQALSRSVELTTNNGTMVFAYLPSGSASIPNVQFEVCDAQRSGEQGRSIQINLTGRPKTAKFRCPI